MPTGTVMQCHTISDLIDLADMKVYPKYTDIEANHVFECFTLKPKYEKRLLACTAAVLL